MAITTLFVGFCLLLHEDEERKNSPLDNRNSDQQALQIYAFTN